MQPWTADQAKASLLFFFSLQKIGALLACCNNGMPAAEVGTLFGWGLPSFGAGLLLGVKAWDLLKAHRVNYHAIVHGFLVCIGSYLIVKNLFLVAG